MYLYFVFLGWGNYMNNANEDFPGDATLGSRYNSALTYINTTNDRVTAIIVSEDKNYNVVSNKNAENLI
ncbi:hypothetical protein SDC9_175717 [bioreactor metagenome]|uniref:Uncharacterized protein n=1 Tax=bioreactor metagenome TaxID=1076179 RepID=A0A645GQ10_9ZZZZ